LSLLELRDVAGLSLSIEEGEVVALGDAHRAVFASVLGTAKTQGEVLLDGSRLYRRTPERLARRGVVHLPAGGGTFAAFTVLDNLRLGAWTHRAVSPRDLARVYEALPVLYDLRRRRVATLAADERRLVALGRVMMAKPRLLLADEPAYGVDATAAREVFELLHAINARGAAFLLVDGHDALVRRLASRVVGG
jgi:branched-chain amino acid transport system ATP-binding protein